METIVAEESRNFLCLFFALIGIVDQNLNKRKSAYGFLQFEGKKTQPLKYRLDSVGSKVMLLRPLEFGKEAII